jgi:pimeloyl-ACP methyl ester carboxylesterase
MAVDYGADGQGVPSALRAIGTRSGAGRDETEAAMRITTDDGVGLEVERTGSGPPLVLVHGFYGAKEDFADHVDRLGEHATVVSFDLRGHGESDKAEDAAAYSLDRMAADVLAVADALGLATFRLLGHSMGGMVARRVVLAHPDRVAALALMNTSPGRPDGMDPEMMELGAQIALSDGMDELRRVMDAFGPLRTPADDRVRAERPGYIEYGDEKWMATPPIAWATIVREMATQPDQLEEMRAIGCPTLVIVGEQDTPFFEPSRQMGAVIPHAQLDVIPDAGHSPQFENPGAWFAAVAGFLRSLPVEAIA